MVVKGLSLLAYYGDLIANLDLCFDYSNENLQNATTGEFYPDYKTRSLSWALVGFLGFGRVVSILFFLFSFGIKNVPNVQR